MARFTIDGIDVGPDDLAAQLPVTCRLLRKIPGPDRPDYYVAAPVTPIRYRTTRETLGRQGATLATTPGAIPSDEDGVVDLEIRAVVIAARIVGQAPHAGMSRFPVMLAYAIDESVLDDEQLDFSKLAYVAVAFISDVAAPAASEVRPPD